MALFLRDLTWNGLLGPATDLDMRSGLQSSHTYPLHCAKCTDLLRNETMIQVRGNEYALTMPDARGEGAHKERMDVMGTWRPGGGVKEW